MDSFVVEYFRGLIKHMEFYNSLAPFPPFDTDVIKDIVDKIKIMEKDKTDYDSLPVSACKLCHNLYTVVDELENDICMRCGSINEIEVFSDIFEYKKIIENED